MGGGYGADPQGLAALARKFTELSSEIKTLRRALNGLGIRIDGETDDVILGNDTGRVRVTDGDQTVALFGALPPEYDRADGSTQAGFIFYREDGSTAAVLGDLNATTPPFKQSLQIFDRSEHAIFSDDTNSGKGIATPHLAVGAPANTDITTWPKTGSSAWTTIASCYITKQNPGMQFAFYTVADAGTTGKIRISIDGTPVTVSPTVNSTFAVWNGLYYWPSSWSFLDGGYLEIQAQVLTGSGDVYAQTLQLMGVQS